MKKQNVKATENYTICYPDPLNLTSGEVVHIIRSEAPDSDWFGWHYCKDENGKEGWLPK